MMKNYLSYKILSKCLTTRCCNNVELVGKHKTAGIIVIGDEILKGETVDTNSNFASKFFFKQGIKLKKISVIGDDVTQVSKEVEKFSKQYDYVISSGGIGPTHDDITFEAIAKAFGEKLVPNEEMKELAIRFKLEDSNKMIMLPQSAKLTKFSGLLFPGISVRNVYLFPGTPQFFVRLFQLVAEKFNNCSKFYQTSLYFNVPENIIIEALNYIIKEFPEVSFGSYPIVNGSEYHVKITIESSNETEMHQACKKFVKIVPENCCVIKKEHI